MTQTNSQAPSLRLDGKTALVTGGSRGVGRDIALRLAEAGADVILTYRSQADQAAEVTQAIQALDRRAVALDVDLTGAGQVGGLVERVQAQLKDWRAEGLDILVNNAGIISHQTLGTITEEEFDRVVDVDFKSVVFLTQGLLPVLNDGGRIVAIGTGLTRFSMPGFAVYGSIKAALERFMRNLAAELGPRGITANAVAPGALDTDMNKGALEHNPGMRDQISAITALGRMGLAEDIGGVVTMLCSPAGRWVTGQRIEVSGGMML